MEGVRESIREVEKRFWSAHVGSFTTGIGGKEESWMGPLIGVHHVLTILEVGEGLPCGIMERVALPLDKVLGSGAMEALLQKGLHFILGVTIDDDGRGEGVRASRGEEGRRVGVGEKLAHMEDVVNLYVGGEVKGASGRGGSLDDLEGADVSGLELGGW